MRENEINEIMGYLSNPCVDLRYDVQVPPKNRVEFESTYQDLTGAPIGDPGAGGYSVLGSNVNKRSIQYRISYVPAGIVPGALLAITEQVARHPNRKRVSNKKLLLEMFERGFILGTSPSKERIISRIRSSYRTRFEFGYCSAFSNQKPLKFGKFSNGFAAVYGGSQDQFSLFDESSANISRSTRVGRSAAFRQIVLQAYCNQCCVCAGSLVDLFGFYETEAAHIVPKSHAGSDDARNGLALCRKHHWAFDRGMFGIDNNYRILVPDRVSSITENVSLLNYNGSLIECFHDSATPHLSALDWHRNHILSRAN